METKREKKCISEEKPRVLRKRKLLLDVPKLTSTVMELRKDKPERNRSGPLQVMDPTASCPPPISLMKVPKLSRNHPFQPPPATPTFKLADQLLMSWPKPQLATLGLKLRLTTQPPLLVLMPRFRPRNRFHLQVNLKR